MNCPTHHFRYIMDFLIHNFADNELEIIIIITISQIVLFIYVFLFCDLSLCLVLVLTRIWDGKQSLYVHLDLIYLLDEVKVF